MKVNVIDYVVKVSIADGWLEFDYIVLREGEDRYKISIIEGELVATML